MSGAEHFRAWNFTPEQADGWRAHGVTEAFEALRWRTAGVAPNEVRRWLGAGITAVEAMQWHDFGFDLDAAREYRVRGWSPAMAHERRHGWSEALQRLHDIPGSAVPPRTVDSYINRQWVDDEAVDWALAGVDATDATLWLALGVTATDAAALAASTLNPVDVLRERWRAGVPFDELASLLRAALPAAPDAPSAALPPWRRRPYGPRIRQGFDDAGISPPLTDTYDARGWLDAEAVRWASAGLDATDATAWRTLGLAPTEAARLADLELTPGEVIATWWRTEIPFDEVAAWLGAGFSPAEARDQRAAGVDAERTATFRALWGDGNRDSP